MTIDNDPRTRTVLDWLREDAHEDAQRVLLAALDEVDRTPQRRSWLPWGLGLGSGPAKLAAAGVAVVLVALVGSRFLPVMPGGGSSIGQPPAPPLLAKGSFTAKGVAETVLDATGSGDDVRGTMAVDHGTGAFTVDLRCSRTTDDGRLLIGGDTLESTSVWARAGSRTAIVLKPGTPVYAVFEFEQQRGEPAASCLAFLDGMVDEPFATTTGPDALEPIEGTVQLAP